MSPFQQASAFADRLRPFAPLALVGLGDSPLVLGALFRRADTGSGAAR